MELTCICWATRGNFSSDWTADLRKVLLMLLLLTRWWWKCRRAAPVQASKMFPAARCNWRGFLLGGSSWVWPSWRLSTCPPGGSGRQCHSYRLALRGKTPSGHSHAPPHFPGRRSRWSCRYRRRRRNSVLMEEKAQEMKKVSGEKQDAECREGKKKYIKSYISGCGRRRELESDWRFVMTDWLTVCAWVWSPHNSRWTGLITTGLVINGVVL